MKNQSNKPRSLLNKNRFRQFLATFIILFVGLLFTDTSLYYGDISYSFIISGLVCSFLLALANHILILSPWFIRHKKTIELKDQPIVFIIKHFIVFFVVCELTHSLIEYHKFSYYSLKDGIQISFFIALDLTIVWYQKEYSR